MKEHIKDLVESLKWTLIYLVIFGVVFWSLLTSTAVIDTDKFPGELNPNRHEQP